MYLQPRQKTSNLQVLFESLVTIDGKKVTFKFRGPSRAELFSAQSVGRGNLHTYYECLIKECVISPILLFDDDTPGENEAFILVDEFLPGEIANLGKAIEKASGITDSEVFSALASKADEYIASEHGKLDLLALAVLPGLTPMALLNCDPETLIKIWKLAETIAIANGVDTRIFLDPEAYLKDVEKANQKQMLAQKQLEAEEFMKAAHNRRGKQRSSTSNSVSL